MMKERNERIRESIEIIARKKAKIPVLITTCACILLFVLVGMFNYAKLGIVFDTTDIIAIVIAVATIVLLYYGLKESYTNQETYNANVRKTEEKLIKGHYVEVVPKEKSEFVSDLCNRAQFFATAGENEVHILVRYNGESDYIQYDVIDKGYLWDKYEFVEENEN